VSPPSWSLFHKAIIQSGAFTKWGSHSMEIAEQNYARVLSAAGCNSSSDGSPAAQLLCLVDADAEVVSRAGDVPVPCRDGCAWAPVVDGVELPDFPLELLAAGRVKSRVPLLLSSTSSDGAGFLDEIPTGLTFAKRRSDWLAWYGAEDARELERLYPLSAGTGGTGNSARFSADDWREHRRHTDASYFCPQKWASGYNFSRGDTDDGDGERGSSGGSDVFSMVFDYGYNRTTGEHRAGLPPVATHGAEIPFVFLSRLGWVWEPPWWDRATASRGPAMASGPEQVARLMAGYWTTFAHTGNPNGGARPAWPRAHDSTGNGNSSSRGDAVLWVSAAAHGGPATTVVAGVQAAQCQFWRKRWARYGRC
jgi:carboxylesterase type B